MAEIEIEGKTVEEAIREGLAKLGVARANVDVKILNEGTAGLFGLMGSKPARVRLATREAGAQGTTVDYSLAQETVKTMIGELLALMDVPYTAITATVDGDRVMAAIAAPDSARIIGKNGQTLEAIDLIVNLMLNKDPVTRAKVTVDCEQYRALQEDRLRAMALKAAEQVKRSSKPYRFDPMPSADRRVIHLHLKSDPALETFSEGEGHFRRVGVKLKDA